MITGGRVLLVSISFTDHSVAEETMHRDVWYGMSV